MASRPKTQSEKSLRRELTRTRGRIVRIKGRQRTMKKKRQRQKLQLRLARDFQGFLVEAVESVTGEVIK